MTDASSLRFDRWCFVIDSVNSRFVIRHSSFVIPRGLSPYNGLVPEPLAYDDLPAGSDLAREFTPEGGVTITAAIREPSDRAIRWARRRAVPRAALISALALAGVIALAALVLRQARPGL